MYCRRFTAAVGTAQLHERRMHIQKRVHPEGGAATHVFTDGLHVR